MQKLAQIQKNWQKGSKMGQKLAKMGKITEAKSQKIGAKIGVLLGNTGFFFANFFS